MKNLTEQQVTQLKQQLQQRATGLKGMIQQELQESAAAGHSQLADKVRDAGDEAVIDLLADVDLAIAGMHINELRDIGNALLRMAEYSYGICVDCAGEIGYGRLHAYPTAKRCLRCQTLYEQTHATISHPTL